MQEIQDGIDILNRFKVNLHAICDRTEYPFHRYSNIDHNLFTWTNALQSFQVAARRDLDWTHADLGWVVAINVNMTTTLVVVYMQLNAVWQQYLKRNLQLKRPPQIIDQIERWLTTMKTDVDKLPSTIIPSLEEAMKRASTREDLLPSMSSSASDSGAAANLTENNESAAGPVRPTGKKYKQPTVTGGAYNITNSYIHHLSEFYELHKTVRSQCQSLIDTIAFDNPRQKAARNDPGLALVACQEQLKSLLPDIKQEVENALSAQYRSAVQRSKGHRLMRETNMLLRQYVQHLRELANARKKSSNLLPVVKQLYKPLSRLSACLNGLDGATSSRKKTLAAASSATH